MVKEMRNNNFDILRLLCALLVIVSHSYALLNLHGDEPLRKMTHMMILSDIGLCGFFTISGYLILNSLLNSKSIVSYLAKRLLRIFPGLLVCLIVVIAICSLFYDGQIGYWLQKQTYSFLCNNLGLYTIQYEIPDVFANNPFNTVNGSLWTLAHEFTLYLCIVGLFFIRKHRVLLTILTAIALVLCLIKNTCFANNFSNTVYLGLSVNSFALFAQYFAIGMLMQLRNYWQTNKERWIVVSVCLVLALVGIYISSSHLSIYLKPIIMLCVSVLFILLGEMYWKCLSDGIKHVGDMSYGVYIYSFPLQQILIAILPNITPVQLMCLTIAAVLPIAYVSWKCIEKPALSLKRYV